MDVKKTSSTLTFFVNGKKVTELNPDPEWTLIYYLRRKLKLCGTKLGCGEGGCGACTVMVSKYDRSKDKIIHLAINACLAPICSMHGLAITTVEGIGSVKTKLHPVQERIAKAHGSQCGFCTPGIVMSMYALLRNSSKPTMHDLDITFQGNLCRCTGYRPIIEGYKTFTKEWERAQLVNGFQNGSTCAMGENCCKNKKNGFINEEDGILFERKFVPYNPTQEPIFPPELKLSSKLDNEYLKFSGKNVKWFRPNNLQQTLELKKTYPDAKIIVGYTEVGVEVKFKYFLYPILIQTNYIPEMTRITETETGIKIGASVTLQEMENALKDLIKTKPQYMTRIFASVVDMLYYFGSKQIRNIASVGGNIMTSSPISDLNPIFLAADCILEVKNHNDCYEIVMDKDFFTGYRKNKIENNDLLVAITIPFTRENQYFYAYKQAKRRDDDIAIVNVAVNVYIDEHKIADIKIAFGGMAPTTVMVPKTQQALMGQEWSEQMLEKAYENLISDLPLSPSAPGGMILYRRSLTLSLFFRAYLAISKQLQLDLPENYLSGITGFHYKPPNSSQYFQVVSNKSKTDTVGLPTVHVSAFKQASGEAIYCDDLTSQPEELYVGLVLSTHSHAELVSIDATDALDEKGVHAFFSAKDIPINKNKHGLIFQDEEIFISKKITSQGQILGAIVAKDQPTAQKAARKVKVEYKDLLPLIITLDDAIKHKSFFNEKPIMIEKGDVNEAFKISDHIIEGECRTGGQEHFYLETHCVVVIPKIEDNEMEIISASQHPQEISKLIADMLDIPMSRIVTKAKRLGGGFGGKETRASCIALPAALAAYKLRKPIRCMLDRNEDMMITGSRHPFLVKYKASFNKDGKITGCEIFMYNNGGYSTDLSLSVLERAAFHCQNAYLIPNIKVCGYSCRTNLPSNTAFRGFGAPQIMFAAENMIRDIADFLNEDSATISRLNLYSEGDLTHYNQTLTYCTIRRCWDECLEQCDYYESKKKVEEFNRKNRWKKRGISIVPTVYGIGFTIMFLNQGAALVNIYTDGSVLLSLGGIEMGQGLYTKMIQVASRVLNIPMDTIHISETATDKVPNASPTAASSGSDLNGMAVKDACEKIMRRLDPFKKKNPKGTWQEWVNAAYLDRVSLSATGFYRTPDIGYDFKNNTGQPYSYHTYGVACSVVEIDCLTGDHQVLKTDIVMDLGESLNPAIDVGQIEGAFMQGYGLFILEEMMYSPKGTLLTKGPGTYKLPGFGNIPIEFNVSLLKGAPNPRAVYASKAVGEPPLFLSSSVLFAIKEAIKSARKDAGIKTRYQLNAPATAEKIRMGCVDHITNKFEEPQVNSYIPWNVTV